MNELHNLPSIRKRFVKDFSLPIDILTDPYFDYFMDLYDPHFEIKEKFKWLMEVTQQCNTPDDFFNTSITIANKIKEKVKNTQAYEKLKTVNLDDAFPLKNNIPSKNIYNEENEDKILYSIDLKQANFNALKLVGLHDELEIKDYKDLMARETSLQYYLNSKMIRQVIFGDLHPTRQQRIQKYIINELCDRLKKKSLEVSSASSDEIIVSSKTSIEQIKEYLNDVDENFKFFRVEQFSFTRIHPEHTFYAKNITDEARVKRVEFKNIPSYFFAQAYKNYRGMEPHDNDTLFYHEKMLAQFKEPLFSVQNKKKLKM